MDSSRDEYALLGESINNHEDCITTRGGRKSLNEIHRDGIPRTFGDGELLQQTVGLVTLGFSSHAGCTGLTILFYKFTESRPSIISENETSCFVLTRMSGEYVIVLVLQNTELEIGGVGNVDTRLMTEESIGSYGPIRFGIGEMGFVERVRRKSLQDVIVEFLLLHDNGCTENWFY